MEKHDVTNAGFSKFVEANGYITTAEHKFVWEALRKVLIVNWNSEKFGWTSKLSQVGVVSSRTGQCLVLDLVSSQIHRPLRRR
jgi:formylglycine-generating enzyme required for sulfatase activity